MNYMKIVKLSQINSVANKDIGAIYNIRRIHYGQAILEINKKFYKAIKQVNARSVKKGDIIFASYNFFNQGACLFTVNGLTDHTVEYGEGEVVFDSVKDAFQFYNVTKLSNLYEYQTQNFDYGNCSYLNVSLIEDEGIDTGSYFYLNENGRWCRGSGCEPLKLTLMKEFELTSENVK